MGCSCCCVGRLVTALSPPSLPFPFPAVIHGSTLSFFSVKGSGWDLQASDKNLTFSISSHRSSNIFSPTLQQEKVNPVFKMPKEQYIQITHFIDMACRFHRAAKWLFPFTDARRQRVGITTIKYEAYPGSGRRRRRAETTTYLPEKQH